MNNRLYVGNLSFDTNEQTLRGAFDQFGEVTDCKVITDRETGRSRGFGFVTMGNSEEAQQSISGMDGVMFDGRPLRVNEAEERRPRSGGFGGGGFSGGGGGFGGGGASGRW